MSFTPMSKESMQKLKAEKDEENRNRQIKDIVSSIYNGAISNANLKYKIFIYCFVNKV